MRDPSNIDLEIYMNSAPCWQHSHHVLLSDIYYQLLDLVKDLSLNVLGEMD